MIAKFLILALAAASVQSAAVYVREKAKFTDCGGNDVSMRFSENTISPDPVLWPGNATVAGKLTVLADLPTKDFRIKTTVKRTTPFGVVTVPCVKSLAFGSCDFDVCEYLLPKYGDTFCDKAGICKCPVKKGEYTARDFVQPLPDGPIAGLVIEGTYEGKGEFVDANNKVYGCITIKFDVVKKDQEE